MNKYSVANRRCKLDAGGSILTGASNISITGFTVNTYGASKYERKRIADAMEPLRSRAEQGAPYDAAAREDIPKCYEHTRVAIIEGIQKWAHSQDPDARPFMWIYGPAGSGKTTIMQTVAEIFDKEESLAASFFFSRLSAARPSTKDNFVITLAHQLSLCIPALRAPLADVLSDPSILTKSLPKQLVKLVTGPLKTLRPDQIGDRNILMVDGLDECEGDDAQQDVLNVLEQCFDQFRHRIRILIASRRLSHIQAFFSQNSIAVITQTMPLDNDYRTKEDLTKYLLGEFGRIRGEHPSRSGLPSDWPSRSDIDILVQRASGQFVYASVVMKFIADHGRHPDESLQAIIHLQVDGESKPYEALDAVYAQVLSTIEPQNVEFIFTLMGCMLLPEFLTFSKAIQTDAATVVDSLFDLRPGTTDARINRMSPLIIRLTIPEEGEAPYSSGTPTDGLLFSHASFPEYLLDQSRSKNFFLNMRKVQCSLARRSFEIHSLRHSRATSDHGDTSAGPDLRELIEYCQLAEWTPELQDAVLTFDIRSAFTRTPEWMKDRKRHMYWEGIKYWVLFISWAEYRVIQNRISVTDAEGIRDSLRSMVQSTCSMLLSCHNIDMTIYAVLLTLHNSLYTGGSWSRLYQLIGHDEGQDFMNHDGLFWLEETDDVREASYLWLCQTLAPNFAMNGSFFADGSVYADLALLYVQSIERRQQEWGIIPPLHKHTSWMQKIAVMLSKSAPSEKLATILMQKFLQPDRDYLRRDDENKDFITAILLYLFECGIPYISDHQHTPDFNPVEQVCGICLLFDPYKVECVDAELSRDPTGTSCARLVGATQEDLPPLVNPVPGVPLLWLHIWVLWLANSMSRLFPVAT